MFGWIEKQKKRGKKKSTTREQRQPLTNKVFWANFKCTTDKPRRFLDGLKKQRAALIHEAAAGTSAASRAATLILDIGLYRDDPDTPVHIPRTVSNQTASCPCEVGSMATPYLALHSTEEEAAATWSSARRGLRSFVRSVRFVARLKLPLWFSVPTYFQSLC